MSDTFYCEDCGRETDEDECNTCACGAPLCDACVGEGDHFEGGCDE